MTPEGKLAMGAELRGAADGKYDAGEYDGAMES